MGDLVAEGPRLPTRDRVSNTALWSTSTASLSAEVLLPPHGEAMNVGIPIWWGRGSSPSKEPGPTRKRPRRCEQASWGIQPQEVLLRLVAEAYPLVPAPERGNPPPGFLSGYDLQRTHLPEDFSPGEGNNALPCG